VLVITEPHVHVEPAALEGKERDTLCLTWEERRWTRKRVVTTQGREVALALPTGSLLRPGDVVALEADWYLEIEGKPEPVLAITPRDRNEAIRVAFDVGNLPEALALYSNGLYTIESADPAVLDRHLGQEARVFAVVNETDLVQLSGSVRDQLVVLRREALAGRPVALVANR